MSVLNLAERTLGHRIGERTGWADAARSRLNRKLMMGKGLGASRAACINLPTVRDRVQELVGFGDLLRGHAQEVDTLPS